MKLIQLNIWQGHLIRNALKFLAKERPDFVCLQEVTSSQELGEGFLEPNNLQRLQSELELPYQFFSPTLAYSIMHTTGLYGNCILSRYPLLDTKTKFTHLAYNADYVHREDTYNIRNVQSATVKVEGKNLTIFNHHGYHLLDPNGDKTSVKGLAQVAAMVDEAKRPIILGGDLNVWPQSPALQPLNARLRNLTAENTVRSTLTSFSRADVACDYIFVSEDVNVKSFKVSEEMVSDHKALILEFEL